MQRKYESSDVFQPTSFPEHTYVNRTFGGRDTYEARLKKALKTKGTLTLITGASKSGKTVLCHSVISPEQLLELSGSHIQTIEDFWKQIAENLQIPLEIETTHTSTTELNTTGELGGKISLPFVADVNTKGALGGKFGESEATKEKIQRSNNQMVDVLIRNDQVLVIDDFHYIPKEIQKYIARVLKNEIFFGLKTVLISLPHRSDDAIRLNPDLIGRVRYINIEPWSRDELREIPKIGFDLLGVSISDDFLDLLVQESITSPQLMQQNCLNLTYVVDIDGNPLVNAIADLSIIYEAFVETTRDHENYEVVKRKLIAGPPQGRNARSLYSLRDDNKVDIYHVILESLAVNPPTIYMDITDLRLRISTIFKPGQSVPNDLTISNALTHIQKILHESGEMFQILEWKDQVLHVLDPYFLFYLRWSK